MKFFANVRFDRQATRDAELGIEAPDPAINAVIGAPPSDFDPTTNVTHARIERERANASVRAPRVEFPPLEKLAALAAALLLLALATVVEVLALIDVFAELGLIPFRRLVFSILSAFFLFFSGHFAAGLFFGPLDSTGRRHPPRSAWIGSVVLCLLLSSFSVVRLSAIDEEGLSSIGKIATIVIFFAMAAGPCLIATWALGLLQKLSREGTFRAIQRWIWEATAGVVEGNASSERERIEEKSRDWNAKADAYRLRYQHVQARARAEMRARGFAPPVMVSSAVASSAPSLAPTEDPSAPGTPQESLEAPVADAS